MRVRPISLRFLLFIYLAGTIAGCSIFSDGDDQMDDDLFDAELDNMASEDEEENSIADPEMNSMDGTDTMLSSEGLGGGSFDNFGSDPMASDFSNPATTAGTEIITEPESNFDPSSMGMGMGMGMDSGMPADSAMTTGGFMDSAPSSPMPAPMPAASGDARVYYVAQATDIVDSPNGQQVVGTVRKGDPVLAAASGEWANILNRGWIRMSNLSAKPVGRSKPTRSWQ